MKKITLCADDYGQSQCISQAIVALLEQKRLSATSCMTTSPAWPESAKWLSSFKNQVDTGLHFNLTEGFPLSKLLAAKHGFMPLSMLLRRAHFRMLNASAIEAELHAQLDLFESEMGQLPDFIDGHQHAHQLPIIRSVLVKVYEARLRKHNSYVRCVYDPMILMRLGRRYFVKNLIVHLLSGAAGFKKMLVEHKIPHNSSFAGVYQFGDSQQYSSIFPRFLRQISDGGIIMCHPGLEIGKKDESDPIAQSRYDEFRYFESEQFISDCRSEQVEINSIPTEKYLVE